MEEGARRGEGRGVLDGGTEVLGYRKSTKLPTQQFSGKLGIFTFNKLNRSEQKLAKITRIQTSSVQQ